MTLDELLYDPSRASFRADPYPTYARFRSEAPIVLSATGLRVVSRHADVSKVLRSPDVSRDIDESAIDLAGDERARRDLRRTTRGSAVW
jgi:cytochrome P450